MELLKWLVFLIPVVLFVDCTGSPGCPSTQYIEMRTQSSLECNFAPTFDCAVWYEVPSDGPLITLNKGEKSGPGYETGEYDISGIGLLQINNVSLAHDRFFRVVVLYNMAWEDDIRQDIRVKVYIKPEQGFPKIDVCENENYCLTKVNEQIDVTCYVTQSRPTVGLQWLLLNDGERELESRIQVHQFDHTASSVVVTTVEITEGNLLDVILCRAFSGAPVMEETDAVVLIEGNIEEIPWRYVDTQLVEIHQEVLLDIKLENTFAVVWKKLSPVTFEYETIGHYAYSRLTMSDPELMIKGDGSLQIRKLMLHHEGEYICVYATQLKQGIRQFFIEVFIPPSPPFTTIAGCVQRNNCQMDIAETGSLTCTLKGIRPVVHVEWYYPGEGHSPVRFITPKTSINRRGSTFDIIVTTYFEIVEEYFSEDFSVSCRAIGLSENMPQMSSSVTLHLISNINVLQNETRTGGGKFSIALNVITVLALITILTVMVIMSKKENARNEREEEGQMTRTNEQEQLEVKELKNNDSQQDKIENKQDKEKKEKDEEEREKDASEETRMML